MRGGVAALLALGCPGKGGQWELGGLKRRTSPTLRISPTLGTSPTLPRLCHDFGDFADFSGSADFTGFAGFADFACRLPLPPLLPPLPLPLPLLPPLASRSRDLMLISLLSVF